MAATLLSVGDASARDVAPGPLIGPQGGQETEQLTPGGRADLERLLDRMRHGALAPAVPDVTEVSFGYSFAGLSASGAIQLHRVRSDGSTRAVVLLRPPSQRMNERPRWFALLPDPGLADGELDRLSTLLDETFVADPWTRTPESEGPPQYRPVSRRRVLWGSALVAASLLLALAYVFGSRPRSRSESLLPPMDG